MKQVVFYAIGAILSFEGCAARQPVTHTDTSKLAQRLEEIAQREAQNQQQIDELNNRLSVLEDKMESSRVVMHNRSPAPPVLPVIRLKPRSSETEEGVQSNETEERENIEEERAYKSGEEDIREGGESMVDNRIVTYAGAAEKDGPRPLLRLYGGSDDNLKMTGANSVRIVGPDPAKVREKLPVVPLPKLADKEKPRDASLILKEYNDAMAKYKAGQYKDAAQAFRNFMQRYAKHAYASNALYWIGECSYDLKDYSVALKTFQKVVSEYPKGNKTPDALLKIAYCYIRMNEPRQARMVLAQVVENYPNSQVARLAHQTLVGIKQ